MKWSEAHIPTLKQAPAEAEAVSHRLMARAALIRRLSSGVYSYLPLGLKVLAKIENIIRGEMNSCGGQEVLLPAMQPAELWKESGRYDTIGEVMVSFRDRHGKEVVLGPTHEEVITDLVRKDVRSYRQLPLILYQIQTKFRDELRPRFGVIRSSEFIMKDAYSFDRDNQGLNENYKKMLEAYRRIFHRSGLDFVEVEADPGIMGGGESREFMVPAEIGEDIIWKCASCGYVMGAGENKEEAPPQCPKCKKDKLNAQNCIEVGHIFKLGTKYSRILKAAYLDTDGKEKPVVMGCYGIGVNRIIAAVIEQNHDDKGIIWPVNISPYKVLVSPLNTSHAPSYDLALSIYHALSEHSEDVLIDDRDIRPGVKFKDGELLGIPLTIVIGEKTLKQDKVEIVTRRDNKTFTVKSADVLTETEKLLDKYK